MALSDKYNFEPLNPLQWGKQMPTMPGAMAPDPTWAGGLLGAGYRHPHAVTPLLYSTGARAIPTATKFAAQGAKEIWQSPIGDAVKRYGWDALSQGLGWWGTNRLREFAGDLEEGKYDTEPGTIPIGGDPLRQDTTPPLFGYDSVGSARIAEEKFFDDLGYTSKSMDAARNLENRLYWPRELRQLMYPVKKKGQPKPSPFSAEELKWMGVPDYLKAMENSGQKVSRADLIEYMENNRILLKEEVRSEESEEGEGREQGPTNIDWGDQENYFDRDQPAWSEQVAAEIPDHVDDFTHDIGLIKEHYDKGGGDRGVRNLKEELQVSLTMLEELMSKEGWAISDMQGLGWRTEQEIEEKATTLAEHMVAYNYEQEPFLRIRGRIPDAVFDPDRPEGSLYELIGNDETSWRVKLPDGSFLSSRSMQTNELTEQHWPTSVGAEEAANENALHEGLLTEEYEEDEEQRTVAGPGTTYERYNLYGLEGSEPDTYQEIIMSYNQWGPLAGANYPLGGLAGKIPEGVSTAVDRGINLYSEPHFGTRNAFLHMRMHDRYFPADEQGNVLFNPMGKAWDSSRGEWQSHSSFSGTVQFPLDESDDGRSFDSIFLAQLRDAGLQNISIGPDRDGDIFFENVNENVYKRIERIANSINNNQIRGENKITIDWDESKFNPEFSYGDYYQTDLRVVQMFKKDEDPEGPPDADHPPASIRVFDEIQSTWNTIGRDKGFYHPTKWTVFNPITGKDLGWYDTEEEMLGAHPQLDDDALSDELGFADRAEHAPANIDYLPPGRDVMRTTRSRDRGHQVAESGGRLPMHPLMNKGEAYMAGFKRFLMKAKQDGVEYVFIPGGHEQATRYSIRPDDKRYQKMINFYDEMFPRLINKFLKKSGSEKMERIGLDREGTLKEGWLFKMTPAIEAAIMEGLDLYSKVIKPKAGLLGRREEGLLAYA